MSFLTFVFVATLDVSTNVVQVIVPTTSSVVLGVAVLIPTLPPLAIRIFSVCDVPVPNNITPDAPAADKDIPVDAL